MQAAGSVDRMYQNYIFDLYGTLVDIHTNEEKSTLWEAMSWYYSLQGAPYTAELLKESYNVLTEQEAEKQIQNQGIPKDEVEVCLDKVFGKLYEEKGINADRQLVQGTGGMFRSLSLERLGLFEGAAKLLDKLRAQGKGVYLLSNAQRLFTEPELRFLGIYDKFDGILYSSDAGVKKPAYNFFDKLFNTYGLEKHQSVMIGNDSMADVGGAHEFGIDSIYIHTEQSPEKRKLPHNCREITGIAQVWDIIR